MAAGHLPRSKLMTGMPVLEQEVAHNSVSENLLYQYDQIVAYVDGYLDFVGNISSRPSPKSRGGILEWLGVNTEATVSSDLQFAKKVFLVLISSWKAWPLKFIYFKSNNGIIAIIAEDATDDKKTNEFFQVATSDYPQDALATNLKEKFSTVDFSKLKRVHDLKKMSHPLPNPFSLSNLAQPIGLIAATSALILKSMPKKLIEDTTWRLIVSFGDAGERAG
jgi:hypothetical protein